MKKGLLFGLLAASLFSSGWAFHLIGKHNAAVADLLTPGALCGPDGGCSAVLGSEYSEIFGIAVSAPAVPMYLALAVLAGLVLAGRLSARRLSAIAVACGVGGVLFGGWLLFHMLVTIRELCPYCLIMDGLNLLVLFLGAAVHPEGFKAGLRSPLDLLPRLKAPGPEWGVAAAMVVGTAALHFAVPVPEAPASSSTALAVSLANQLKTGTTPGSTAGGPTEGTPAPAGGVKVQGGAAGGVATAPASALRKPPTGPAAPGTRRLVLPEEVHEIPLDASVPTKGPADAPVTIVLFEDFQCPYCKKLSGNVEVLLEELGDEVRLAFMHYPMHQSCNANELKKSLHRFACGAAAASVCAHEQGRFWEMHDLMFRNSTRLKRNELVRYAQEIGLDTEAFSACLTRPETLAKVKRDSEIGGKATVTGTPALFINGRKLVGAQPVESLAAAVAAVRQGGGERLLLDVELEPEFIGLLDSVPTEVTLDGRSGPFTIDAFEASLSEGRAASVAGVESAGGVTWYEADKACKAAGKRLCSEEEWLTACSGALPVDENGDGVFSNDTLRGRQHSYGEHYRSGWCADGRKKSEPGDLSTGTHPKCGSPEGVYDLEGLRKEWVGLTPDKAALKGGSFFSGVSARCGYHVDDESPESRDPSIGFRCCSGEGAEQKAQARDGRFPGGKVGDAIRGWEGPKRGGGTYGDAAIGDRPYIMTFWASWCGPCKQELPVLAEVYEEYRGRGLEIVGVNVDEDPAAAEAYLKRNPLPFPVVLDPDKAVMRTFDTRGVPTTFWVRRDGTIRGRSVGYDETGGKRKVVEDVEALLD